MTAPELTGAVWRKSSRSNGQGQCVEVAQLGTAVAAAAAAPPPPPPPRRRRAAVRDSKNPMGSVLIFTPGEWTAFLAGAKAGEFDE